MIYSLKNFKKGNVVNWVLLSRFFKLVVLSFINGFDVAICRFRFFYLFVGRDNVTPNQPFAKIYILAPNRTKWMTGF
tara:strand:- start:1869 stop:2099 length:231 start_codon:yes stop_codon:yes gene_type:complete